MNFLNKTSEDEFYTALESGMKKFSSFDENLEDQRIIEIRNLLKEASDYLKEAGMEDEAGMVCQVSDEATKGLTSEKMLKNLEEKGWMFNADDQAYCSEGEEPPMSQEELKALRRMLKSF